MATANSQNWELLHASITSPHGRLRSGSAHMLGVAVLLAATYCGMAATPLPAVANAPTEPLAVRYENMYLQLRERFQRDTNNREAAWQFARACFDWADLAASKAKRMEIAQQGIAACRSAIAHDPKLAAAHYYLGLNLGQVAQTKKLGALPMLQEMATAWKAALAADEKFDYAGPHRSLGLLYRDAPGWPVGIGDRTQARQHLKRAVELNPDFPDNQLCWLESLWDWGDRNPVRAQIPAAEIALANARTKLTGAAWERDWKDWDGRWAKLKAKAAMTPTESPHQKK